MGILERILPGGKVSNRQKKIDAAVERGRPMRERKAAAQKAYDLNKFNMALAREKRLEPVMARALERRRARQKAHIAAHPKDLVCQKYAI